MRQRGFEVAKGWEDQNIELPSRSTTHAAAYDIASAVDLVIPPYTPGAKPTFIPTGLKAYCQPDEYYLLANRSSGSTKGLVLANGIGIIDADYYENPTNDGHFQILVYNLSGQNLEIKKGQKVAQAIFQKFLTIDDDRTGGQRVGGFGSTDKNIAPLQIIYDLDDVLWELTSPVMRALKLDHKVQTDFCIQNDDAFTEAEKAKIMAAFMDVESFRKIEFYPAAKEILHVSAPDVRVSINSNSYSPEIAALKHQRLQEFLPNLPAEDRQINLVTPNSNRKQIDQSVLVFVDDSPYNVGHSLAKFNLMPIKTWNTTTAAREIAVGNGKKLRKTWQKALPSLIANEDHYVIPVQDLSEANKFIRMAIKIIKGEKHVQK